MTQDRDALLKTLDAIENRHEVCETYWSITPISKWCLENGPRAHTDRATLLKAPKARLSAPAGIGTFTTATGKFVPAREVLAEIVEPWVDQFDGNSTTRKYRCADAILDRLSLTDPQQADTAHHADQITRDLGGTGVGSQSLPSAEALAKFLDASICTSNPIGPLYGAGWNSCIDYMRDILPRFLSLTDARVGDGLAAAVEAEGAAAVNLDTIEYVEFCLSRPDTVKFSQSIWKRNCRLLLSKIKATPPQD